MLGGEMVNWQAKGVAAKVPSTELGSWGSR